MKAARNALIVVLILHALAVAGGVGWLHLTGRLNRERVKRAVEVFEPTIDQEKDQVKAVEAKAQEAKAAADEAIHMQKISMGAASLTDRLTAEQDTSDLAAQKLERLQRDISDLRKQLEDAKGEVARQKADLLAQRDAFHKEVEKFEKQQNDANFQQAVAVYEQLPAKQVKQIFQQMLTDGRTDAAVNYLAAMQLRKTAAVLKEFKSEGEVAQSAELMKQLRQRGIGVGAAASRDAQAPASTPGGPAGSAGAPNTTAPARQGGAT
jgi:hypothetical protein